MGGSVTQELCHATVECDMAGVDVQIARRGNRERKNKLRRADIGAARLERESATYTR